MDRGLRAPLSTKEEIALRRVANGTQDVGLRQVERLVQLALVRYDHAHLRLTENGERRLSTLVVSPLGAARSRQPS